MPSTSEHLVVLELKLKCLGLNSMWRMAEVPTATLPTVTLPFISAIPSAQGLL